ncbi:hypothetical protein ABVT39_000661 [Epinephelus coioides]
MSEDSTPTLSVIAPLHAQLLQDTDASFAGDTPIVREIKLAIHDDLAKRYTTVQNKTILYTTSTLDPRFKALPFLAKDEQLDIHTNVIAEAAALQKEMTPGKAEDDPEKDPESDPEEGPAPKKSSALFNLLGKTFTETDNIDVKRECILKALSVYLNEDPEKVVKERMDSDVDNGQAEMETVFGVVVIRREGAERDDGPEDVGIILGSGRSINISVLK